MMGYAIKYTPVDKGVPGWLCDGFGNIALFSSTLPGMLQLASEKVLPGAVNGVYLYEDRYPENAFSFPLSLDNLMNYVT